MKAILAIIPFLVVSLVSCPGSFAVECHTDLDCTVGIRCVKQGYDATGTCLESTQPPKPDYNYGLDNEKPQRDTKGKICWGKKDCESGLECIMKSGQMYGTCR